jgi:hypothetical protein
MYSGILSVPYASPDDWPDSPPWAQAAPQTSTEKNTVPIVMPKHFMAHSPLMVVSICPNV